MNEAETVKTIEVINFCPECGAKKFVDGKCIAYQTIQQERWILNSGWCPLGNVGPTPPSSWEAPNKKRRVGQQKQAKK